MMSQPGIRSIATLEVLGGPPCLDFANTVNCRPEWQHDYLSGYGELVAWCERVGLVDGERAARLGRLSRDDPKGAERVLRRAVDLRELTYRVFSAIAAGGRPGEDDLAALVALDAAALYNGHVAARSEGYEVAWDVGGSLDALLWPLAHSMAGLVVGGPVDQVKECPRCGWLFLDTSRNRSRRWGSMATCRAGAGAKAQARGVSGRQQRGVESRYVRN